MSDESRTFKLGDNEYPLVLPRGRKGRKATNFLLSKFGDAGADVGGIIDIMDSDEFEEKHLPVILGIDKKILEEEGTSGEILQVIMMVVSELFSALEEPDVEEAVKNSSAAQEKEGE